MPSSRTLRERKDTGKSLHTPMSGEDFSRMMIGGRQSDDEQQQEEDVEEGEEEKVEEEYEPGEDAKEEEHSSESSEDDEDEDSSAASLSASSSSSTADQLRTATAAAAPSASSALRDGWLGDYDAFCLRVSRGVDHLSSVDFRPLVEADIEVADGRPCVYWWGIRIEDEPAYLSWLRERIAKYVQAAKEAEDEEEKKQQLANLRRFERLPLCVEACDGQWLQYFGCSTDIKKRYNGEAGWITDSSQIHHVHRTAKEDSFKFACGVLSVSTAPVADPVTNTQVALAMEEQLGVLLGIDGAAVADGLVINAQVLGRGSGIHSKVARAPQLRLGLAHIYYWAKPGEQHVRLRAAYKKETDDQLTAGQQTKNFVRNYLSPLRDQLGLPPYRHNINDQQARSRGSLLGGTEAVYGYLVELVEAGWQPWIGSTGNAGMCVKLIAQVFDEWEVKKRQQLRTKIDNIGRENTEPARKMAERVKKYWKEQMQS